MAGPKTTDRVDAALASADARLALVQIAGEEAHAWTERRDRAMVDAYNAGASIRELARASGMSLGGVQRAIGLR